MQKFITYKNAKIHFSSTGKGSAIVLLHGFLEDISMWKNIVPILSKKHRVITIDLLGHGKTKNIGYVHTMQDHAKMVHAILQHLQLRRYFLIGHSMGGYIALAYAKLYPKTIKGVCLHNSTFHADDDELKQLRIRANKMAQTNFKQLVQMSFTNLFSEKSRSLFKKELKEALQIALKTPLQAYIASQEGMRIREDSEQFFKNALFKKTIIIGKKDSVVKVDKLVEFGKKHQIKTYLFSNGHMSHIKNKNELIIALQEFVASTTL